MQQSHCLAKVFSNSRKEWFPRVKAESWGFWRRREQGTQFRNESAVAQFLLEQSVSLLILDSITPQLVVTVG